MDTQKNISANLILAMQEKRDNGSALGTQLGLSKAAGLSQSMVGYVMHGSTSISVERLDKIAKALNISTWQMLLPHDLFKKRENLDNLLSGFLALSQDQQKSILGILRSMNPASG